MEALYKELRRRLRYEPETGLFVYIVRVAQMMPGDIAGRPNTNGYIQISIDSKRYLAQNLAWLYMTGEYPVSFCVDHKNRIKHDNKWDNFRAATRSQNCANLNMKANNTSGYRGVSWNKEARMWIAQIGYKGGKITIGRFVDPEEASDAYKAYATHLFGEFVDGI